MPSSGRRVRTHAVREAQDAQNEQCAELGRRLERSSNSGRGMPGRAMNDKSSRLDRFVPILSWMPQYEKRWLRPDLLAGLTVWALLIPEAMAYAKLAGMPAETGLYAGIGAIVGYAIFGSSRHLSVGPNMVVAIMSAATVGQSPRQPTMSSNSPSRWRSSSASSSSYSGSCVSASSACSCPNR